MEAKATQHKAAQFLENTSPEQLLEALPLEVAFAAHKLINTMRNASAAENVQNVKALFYGSLLTSPQLRTFVEAVNVHFESFQTAVLALQEIVEEKLKTNNSDVFEKLVQAVQQNGLKDMSESPLAMKRLHEYSAYLLEQAKLEPVFFEAVKIVALSQSEAPSLDTSF